jgi:tetratricopeptide (TPR) repeat protein
MRHVSCSQCARTGPARTYFAHNHQIYCADCAEYLRLETVPGARPSALLDPTICSRCQADNGNTEFPIVGSLPLCPTCQDYVDSNPYPVWLKVGLAAMLCLLVVALVNGRKYFHAGRSLYVGERLVDEGHFEQALPYLQEALRIAPESDKAVLLTAKAALKIGRADIANEAIQGHEGGHFQDPGADFQEVKALWDRANKAFDKAEKAAKLEDQDGNAAQAAQLMHQAATEYPESPALGMAAEMYDEGTAFERRDYDAFLSIAQKMWKAYPNGSTAGSVASALACKYAVTGDDAFRQQSEEMLRESEKRGEQDEQWKKAYPEFAERTRYRLTSREIISKTEYDRRFRKRQTAAK